MKNILDIVGFCLVQHAYYLMYPTSFSTSHLKLFPLYFPNVIIS